MPLYGATMTNAQPGDPRDVLNPEIRSFLETAPVHWKRQFAWRCLHQGALFLRALLTPSGISQDVLLKFSAFEDSPTSESLMSLYWEILKYRGWGQRSLAITDVLQAFQRACENWDYVLSSKPHPDLPVYSDPGHAANMIVRLIVPRVTPAVESLLCDWIRGTLKAYRSSTMLSQVDAALEHLSLED